MVGIGFVQNLSLIITLVLAYFISVIPAGFFQAWVAKKMGDPTAAQLGFLSLHPMVYVDPFGLFLLIVLRMLGGGIVVWGRTVPMSRHNIPKNSMFAFAYLSNVIAHIVIATVSLVGLVLLFGPKILMVGGLGTAASLKALFPEKSALVISLGVVLSVVFALNIATAAFWLIFRVVYLVFMIAFNVPHEYFVGPTPLFVMLALWILIGPFVSMGIYWGVSYIGILISHVLGAV